MHEHAASPPLIAVVFSLFAVAMASYAVGVALQYTRRRPWPVWRTAAWAAGLVLGAAACALPWSPASPLGEFEAHMLAHVAAGMAAPVLLVAAAPVTLALRSLHVTPARRLSRTLRSFPFRMIASPIAAGVLNVGSMFVLYLTPAYALVSRTPLLHTAVMLHFLVAGSLFTAAIIPSDPAPHRAGFAHRTAVLLVALAAHGVLAKLLYADPPFGVDVADAQTGAILMYYAGDIVDAVIITVLFARWYRESGRRAAAPRGWPPARMI